MRKLLLKIVLWIIGLFVFLILAILAWIYFNHHYVNPCRTIHGDIVRHTPDCERLPEWIK